MMTTGNPPKLEDQLREGMRLKHDSFKTEESYVGWYRRYVLRVGKREIASPADDVRVDDVESLQADGGTDGWRRFAVG